MNLAIVIAWEKFISVKIMVVPRMVGARHNQCGPSTISNHSERPAFPWARLEVSGDTPRASALTPNDTPSKTNGALSAEYRLLWSEGRQTRP
jgi:hypothetical protein